LAKFMKRPNRRFRSFLCSGEKQLKGCCRKDKRNKAGCRNKNIHCEWLTTYVILTSTGNHSFKEALWQKIFKLLSISMH
jgi:hypothetical protein